MTTMISDDRRPENGPMEQPMRTCTHCGNGYHWKKSTSTLRLTFCNVLCEKGHLGFTIESLMFIQRAPKNIDV
jgi:hypothetical protein